MAVDDATGRVAGALLCREATTHDYFILLEDPIRRWGIPLSLYTERHAVFAPRTDSRPESSGEPQLTWAMNELGIELILARSPQTKGRVDRMVGTFRQAGHGAAPRGSFHSRRCQQGAEQLPSTFQRAVQGTGRGTQRGIPSSRSPKPPQQDILLQVLLVGGQGQHAEVPLPHLQLVP